MPNRRHSREFKLSAVKLVKEQSYSIVEAARSLRIDPANLRGWLKTFKDSPEAAPTGGGAIKAGLRRAVRQRRLSASVE